MDPTRSLRRLIADLVAPQIISLSRTITDLNSIVTTGVATATNQAQIATTMATTATDKAAAASASSSQASISATASATSATQSAASAAYALAQLRSFNKRWLGDWPNDPTLDLNGDPVADGAEYFNTATTRIRVYYNGTWIDLTAEAAADVQQTAASAAAAAGSAAAAKTYAEAAAQSAADAKNYEAECADYWAKMQKAGFPLALTGFYLPRVKADASGYELRSPSDTLSDIGGAPIKSPSLKGIPLTTAVSDWTTAQIVSATSADSRYISGGSRGSSKVAADSTIVDMYWQAASSSPIVTYRDSAGASHTASIATTAQLLNLSGGAVKQAGFGSGGAGSVVNDYVVSSIGMNRSSGQFWGFIPEQNAYRFIYTTDQVNTILKGYFPITGGFVNGVVVTYLSAGASSMMSLPFSSRIHRTDTGHDVEFRHYHRMDPKPGGNRSYGVLDYGDANGVYHPWRFFPDTGDIQIPTGDYVATRGWSNSTFQRIGDYATNGAMQGKITALRASIDDLYLNKVTTKPNVAGDHRITNMIKTQNWANQYGTAGVGLWADDGSVTQLGDYNWIMGNFLNLNGKQTIRNWVNVNGDVTIANQYSYSGTGVGTGMGFFSPSLITRISGRGNGAGAGYQSNVFTEEIAGVITRMVFSHWGGSGRKDMHFTQNGDLEIPGVMYGTAYQAMLQDLAENYKPDAKYPPGTLLQFGGSREVTICTDPDEFVSVVSDQPGFVLGSDKVGCIPMALVGRVPVRCVGKVKAFTDRLTYHSPGVATRRTSSDQVIIARPIEDKLTDGEGLVECFVSARLT